MHALAQATLSYYMYDDEILFSIEASLMQEMHKLIRDEVVTSLREQHDSISTHLLDAVRSGLCLSDTKSYYYGFLIFGLLLHRYGNARSDATQHCRLS